MQVHLRPFRACERPFLLVPPDELVDVTDLELNAGLFVPSVVFILQIKIKKTELQLPSVVRIEVRPVLDAVRFEIFVFRGGTDETLEVAARMQPLPAPVRSGEE